MGVSTKQFSRHTKYTFNVQYTIIMFTAVKRKKLCRFQSFRALKFESVQTIASVMFVRKQCIYKMFQKTEFYANKTCAR